MIKTLSKTDFSSSILTEKKDKMFLASASSVQFEIELNLFMWYNREKNKEVFHSVWVFYMFVLLGGEGMEYLM